LVLKVASRAVSVSRDDQKPEPRESRIAIGVSTACKSAPEQRRTACHDER
jgi:hypothetical protein